VITYLPGLVAHVRIGAAKGTTERTGGPGRTHDYSEQLPIRGSSACRSPDQVRHGWTG
ncbi:hypothetical protein T265_16343, partial [Opisthorchis viverrini]